MKFHGKKQCWESMGCGKDRDGSCPAYPDYGRLCWPIAGTKYRDGVRGEFMPRPSEIAKNAISLRLSFSSKEGKR